MNEITLPQLAIKILGLVLIVMGIPCVPFAVFAIINAVATQDANSIETLACSFPYILYFVFGCIFLFASKRVYMKSMNATSTRDGYNITRTISATVQLVLGVWLFIGSKGLIGVRDKLRNFGVKDQS
jgi:hypothetical protein